MTDLILYDQACRAIERAANVDEVRDIRDKADAVRHYARQAKNRDLEIKCAEIRMRAERRLGQIRAADKSLGRIAKGGKPYQHTTGADVEQVDRAPTLEELGIDRKLSARADKMAAVPTEQFERMIGQWRANVLAENERVTTDLLRAGDEASKKAQRETREKILGGIQLALPDRKYGVILADPEWRFEVYSRHTGMDRAADNHYPTSETDAICARPVKDIAADDCALFLWATVPMLPDALRVMAAWGFDYKSHCVWLKDRVGTGYWFRNQHELLLVGTRGSVPAPAMGTQFSSVNQAAVGAHSEKPASFYVMIETYFPTLPKIELNARRSRDGWDSWGLEAPEKDDAA